MNKLPVDRALAIYGTIANRCEQKGARDRLSQHLLKAFLEGEHDPHRLTVSRAFLLCKSSIASATAERRCRRSRSRG
jgi:hypothetical protein